MTLSDALFDWGVWGSRHASMFFLVPLVVSLAILRFGPLQFFVIISLSAAVFSSASRTSSAVVLMVLALAVAFLHKPALGKRLLLLGAGGATFLAFLTFSPNVQDRWINNPGDRAFVLTAPDSADKQAPGIFLNTSGRAKVWSALYVEALDTAPFLGNGAGFSGQFVKEAFGWPHPHNEYLRLLADHGVIGLLLLGLSTIFLLLFFLRQHKSLSAERFIGVGSVSAPVLLSVTALPLVSIGVLPASIAVGYAINNSRATLRA